MVDADAKSSGLSDAEDAGHEFLGGQRAVEGFLRVEAIVAVAAIGLRPIFREIAEQDFAAAFGRFGVVHHLA